MNRRQKKAFNRWRRGHNSKRVFRSRLECWLAIASLCLDKRRLDLDLQAYRCRWGPDWRHGRSYPVHWHVGHGRLFALRRRRKRWLQRMIIYPARRFVIWPYYRGRRWFRQVRKRRKERRPDGTERARNQPPV